MKKFLAALFLLCCSIAAVAYQSPEVGVTLAGVVPVTDVDAIAKWAGKFNRQMIGQMLNDLDVFKDLKRDLNVSRHGKLLPKFTAEAGLRPLDTAVERNGRKERTISGRKLEVYDCMKLFEIVPEELRESFLGDMIVPGAKEIPFAQWFWQKEMEKLTSEINDNFYHSEYHADATDFNAGSTYTTGDYIKFENNFYKANQNTAAGESPTSAPAKWDEVNATVCFDGPAKLIADEITATNISPIATGTIDNTNALDKMELMYRSMTEAHRKKGGVFHISDDMFYDYIKHEQSVFGNTNTPDSGDGRKFIYGSNKKWELRPASWMNNSNRVIVNVQKDNLHVGTSLVSNAPKIGKMVPTVHGYLTSAKFLLGFQIADLECLYVNDQA